MTIRSTTRGAVAEAPGTSLALVTGDGEEVRLREFRAEVKVRLERAIASGLPKEDELLELARKRAADPSIFDEHPPFFFSAEISNNRLDAYYSKMQPSSLKNYADDAATGIAFLNSHNSRELPLGGSLAGKYIGPSGNGIARTLAAFYTVGNLHISSINTDEFINGVKAGLVRDVSIGFYGGRSVCSICKGNMWSYFDCPHWPGDEYEIDDKMVMAIELVEDARLAETSAVYDGACPGAELKMKAMQALEAGQLEPFQLRALEARFRINLPGLRRMFPGHSGEEDNMTKKNTENEKERSNETEEQRKAREAQEAEERAAEEKRKTEDAEQRKQEEETRKKEEEERAAKDAEEKRKTEEAEKRAKDAIDKDKLTPDERKQLTDDFNQMRAENQRLTGEVKRLDDENKRLSPLADDGRTYRQDLIEDTLKEGVRALGKNFPIEVQRAVLQNSTLDQIKAIRKSYTEDGNERFPGGRLTTDDSSENEKREKEKEAERKKDEGYVDLKPSTRAFVS